MRSGDAAGMGGAVWRGVSGVPQSVGETLPWETKIIMPGMSPRWLIVPRDTQPRECLPARLGYPSDCPTGHTTPGTSPGYPGECPTGHTISGTSPWDIPGSVPRDTLPQGRLPGISRGVSHGTHYPGDVSLGYPGDCPGDSGYSLGVENYYAVLSLKLVRGSLKRIWTSLKRQSLKRFEATM